MKKNILFGSLAVAVAMPYVAFAANAFTILDTIHRILNIVIPVLITLAVVYFIWGVIQYTISSDEEAKKGARSKIIMSLVGLFVIIAFWGIIELVTNTFGVGPTTGGPVHLPCIPTRDQWGINHPC